MKAYHTSQVMTMAMLGLADQSEIDDGDMEMISITEDFRQAIRPHFDDVLDDFEVKFRLYVEQIVFGALNIYGVLTVSEIKTILKDCMELEDDGTGVFEHIFPQSIAIQMQPSILRSSENTGTPFFSIVLHTISRIVSSFMVSPRMTTAAQSSFSISPTRCISY